MASWAKMTWQAYPLKGHCRACGQDYTGSYGAHMGRAHKKELRRGQEELRQLREDESRMVALSREGIR
jgi:hypothetical protein